MPNQPQVLLHLCSRMQPTPEKHLLYEWFWCCAIKSILQYLLSCPCHSQQVSIEFRTRMSWSRCFSIGKTFPHFKRQKNEKASPHESRAPSTSWVPITRVLEGISLLKSRCFIYTTCCLNIRGHAFYLAFTGWALVAGRLIRSILIGFAYSCL